MENKKILQVAFVVVSLLVFLLTRALSQFVWEAMSLPQLMDWPIQYWDIVGIISAVSSYFVLMNNTKVVEYSSESVSELTKVTWAPRKETLMSTVVVVVMVFVASIILAVMDSIWGYLSHKLLTL